jgi:hypothetical protein
MWILSYLHYHEKIIFPVSFFMMVGDVFAQSNLPACQGSEKTRWSNCFATFTFANGSKYVGEFKDGIPNGHGTFLFVDGSKYVGEYTRGKRHGQGSLTLPGGEKYFGEFRYDKYNG